MTTAATAATTRNAFTEDVDSVAFVAPAVAVMEPRWKRCRDLYDGNEAVHQEGNLDAYFPLGDLETVDEQTRRAARADLFPMLQETVKGLVGLVFRTDPVLQADVPKSIVDLWENLDGAGTHGSVLCKRIFSDGMTKGHAGALVDVPKVSSTRPLTMREERDMGLRPYVIHIKPEQIINWRTQVINGVVVLTLLVLLFTEDEPSGKYGLTTVTRYRVYRRNAATGAIEYEVHRQEDESKEPALEDEGVLKGATRIPFVAFYAGERIAPLQSKPPLDNLAFTNIAHVQVLSDYRSSMHAAGNPILVIKGRQGPLQRDPNAPPPPALDVTNPESGPAAGAVEILTGPNIGIEVDKDGDVTYAEHQGHALSTTRQELQDIETRGSVMGLAMLQRDTRAAQTAEAERFQKGEKSASLSTAARSMKDLIETFLAFIAIYLNEPTGGSVELDMAFEDIMMDAQKIDAYSKLVALGQLTRRTMWKLLQKGRALPDDFDADAEERALEGAEKIMLGGVDTGGAPGGGAPTDTGPADDDVGAGREAA